MLAMRDSESQSPKLNVKDAMAFVRAIHAGQFDAALAFADWIEEGGYPKHALLLRRRWQRWKRERTRAIQKMEIFWSAGVFAGRRTTKPSEDTAAKLVGLSFRRYIQKHYPLAEFNNL